jgi:serine phosphatase RsbU (regulator of sigma subunit)/tetratricopeptide (TPR) repeat protein
MLISLSKTWLFAQSEDLNELLSQLNRTKDSKNKVFIINQIALLYQQQNAPKKAAEYFIQAYEIQKNDNDEEAISATLNNIGNAYKLAGETHAAILYYSQLLQLKQKQGDKKGEVTTLTELANLHKENQDYSKSIEYSLSVLKLSSELNNAIAIAESSNSLGFLYGQIGDQKQSLTYFQRALGMYNVLTQISTSNAERINALTNTGLTYSKIREYGKAGTYYNQALELAKQGKLPVQEANIYNHLASNYFIAENIPNAFTSVNKAVDIAQVHKAEDVLMSSYQILSEIYQKQEDFKEVQKYEKLYQEIKERIVQKEREKVQDALKAQVEVERKENELKNLIADKERQAAELKQSQLERQKQEQDLKLAEQQLAILKQNQALQEEQLKNQRLAQERAQQLLVITQQQAQTEKQKQELAILEQNKKLQEASEREKQSQIDLLEKDKKIQDEQLKAKQEQLETVNLIRNYGAAVFALGAAVFVLILIGYFQNRKKNKLLKRQNVAIHQQASAIQVQNEELQQQQEEIIAQRSYIEGQNKELNNQNYKMSKSIEAALVIQQSILPTEKTFKDIFDDYFSIFYPKDVVSGDCYMLEKIGNKTFVIVVDCTGHGVAGAFMSLIANNLLEKILYSKNIQDPSLILEHLDEDVRIALKKEETGNLYGMDAAIACLEYLAHGQVKLTYAGAKRNLYYYLGNSDGLLEIQGDRRSVGTKIRINIPFHNQEIMLKQGDVIYLTTDGFIDQCDINRQNFGSANFKKLLQENLHLPLNVQKQEYEKSFAKYMQGADQRDDVTFIGIRL